MTASAPRRSWSAYHRSSASPTRWAASSASTSSQEPGKRTTPNFMTGSRSPRSAGWSGAARTSGRAARDPRRPAPRAGRRARSTRRRSPAPGAPAPRSGPAGRGSPPSAGSGPAPSLRGARPLQPGRERLAREPLVGGHVALARGGHHVVGDRRRGRRLVPPRAGGPVAHVLLVERGLPTTRLVLVGRPEARGVRRADLVAEHQLAALVEPELELRVREDDPALARVVGDRAVHGQRHIAHPLGELAVPDQLDGLLEVDRLVVAHL